MTSPSRNGEKHPVTVPFARLVETLNRAVAPSGRRVLEVLETGLAHERPGRRRTVRAVVRVERPGGVPTEETWYAKEYSSSKGARSFRKQLAIRQVVRRGVSVPEPLGYSHEDRLLVMREAAGASLESLLRDASRDRKHPLDLDGEALTGLHEIERGAVPSDVAEAFGPHGPREECFVLTAAGARADGAPFEDPLRSRFHEALETTIGALGTDPAPKPCLLHRDLHPAQIIPGGTGLTLLDTDESAFGEPELDVGNLAAHLILESIRRSAGSDRGSEWVRALAAGYSRRAALRPDRLNLYTASALLRLASLERVAHPSVSPLGWQRLADALVEEARRELSSRIQRKLPYPSSL